MLMISDGKITLTRGDSAHFDVAIKYDNGTAYEMQSGDQVKLTVKKSINDAAALLQKTTSGLSIDISPQDTNELDFGVYQYDVQLIRSNGEVYTVIPCNSFIIEKEVG